MHKIALFVLGGLASAVVPYSVAADSDHMETVIVTATRTEQSIAENLAPITVFERADIERIQPLDIQELLSRATSISFVRNGGRGASTSLFLRGNASNHTLVMVDGVRIGSATLGSPSLTNIPPELIERVEIVRGSRSSLYGSEAIGGVINIITKKFHKTEGWQPLLKVGGGSDNNRRYVAALSGGTATTQANISIFNEETDGIDHTESKAGFHGDNDAFEQQAYNVSLSHQINQSAELYAFYQQSDAESDYDADCYGTGFAQYNCAPFNDSQVRVANVRAEIRPFSNWLLTLSTGESVDDTQVKFRELDSSAVGVIGDQFKTTRHTHLIQNDFAITRNHIATLGFERLLDKVESTQNYAEKSRANSAGFAQWQGEFGPVNTVLGWRHDDNEQFGNENTRNASIGWKITQTYQVIASYGEGFNAPTFNDLYYPFYGNPNLVPEVSENIELELRGEQAWGNWRINHFINDVENLIQYNPATFGPDQIKSAKIKGTELSVETMLLNWNLTANYTYLDAVDDITGYQLRRRPEKQLNLVADTTWRHWTFATSLRVLGKRYEDTTNTDKLAGYGLLDASLAYRVSDKVNVQMAVKNALDKDYVSARSFSLGDYQSVGRQVLFEITLTP